MERDKFYIRLNSLRFFSKIGVFEQERVVGNEFEVSVFIRIDASRFISENLETTISYADVYDEISAIMGCEWLLIESVCKEISERLLYRWPSIERGKVIIDKLTPPIPSIQGSCGVEYDF